MSKVTSLFSPEPEPEKPMTQEERVKQYRQDYRKMLNRAATVFTLPLRKTKAVLKAAATAK